MSAPMRLERLVALRTREETLGIFAYIAAVTGLVYALELNGEQFVPVFWYFFLPAIGWVTFRYGLRKGLASS